MRDATVRGAEGTGGRAADPAMMWSRPGCRSAKPAWSRPPASFDASSCSSFAMTTVSLRTSRLHHEIAQPYRGRPACQFRITW